MTRSFPKSPLWPRAGRSGRSSDAISSSSRIAPAGTASGAAGPRPKPTTRSATAARRRFGATFVECLESLQASQDAPLAIVEPILDVGWEEEAPAGSSDAEGDGHGVVRLMADRDGDARHPELLGPP